MKLMKFPLWAVALVLPLSLSLLTGCAKKAAEEEPQAPKLQVGYASEGVTAVEDPEAMSKALDELYDKLQDEKIALSYKYEAFSDNGQDFTCYIANSPDNAPYDLFIGIYADEEFNDCLFLSQLLRPGSAFESVKLNRALEPGTHSLYVVFTTVETTEEEQIIHGEVAVKMDFNVS